MKKTATLLFSFLLSFSVYAQSTALHFDGTSDHVIIPGRTGVLAGSAVTFEAWVKPTSLNMYNTIINRGNRSNYFLVQFITDNMVLDDAGASMLKVFAYDGRNSVELFHPLADNWVDQWHHVAVTFNGNNLTLFTDGTAASSMPFSGSLPVNSENIWLGNDPDDNFFHGSFDELRIWNVVRTEAQIRATMNTEISASTPNLVAYYRFNQGTVNGDNTAIATATDLIAANDGALMDFDRTGPVSNFTNGYLFLRVLPLKNRSFVATPKGGVVALSWKGVATESTTRFEVEHSEDGTTFQRIGTLPARAASGESDYAFTHQQPMTQNYYRLKTVEADGKSSYSQTLAVRTNGNGITLTILQNPVSSQVRFQLTAPKGLISLHLLDAAGRSLEQHQLESKGSIQTASFNVSQLAKGTYLLSANGTSAWFTKQ